MWSSWNFQIGCYIAYSIQLFARVYPPLNALNWPRSLFVCKQYICKLITNLPSRLSYTPPSACVPSTVIILEREIAIHCYTSQHERIIITILFSMMMLMSLVVSCVDVDGEWWGPKKKCSTLITCNNNYWVVSFHRYRSDGQHALNQSIDFVQFNIKWIICSHNKLLICYLFYFISVIYLVKFSMLKCSMLIVL